MGMWTTLLAPAEFLSGMVRKGRRKGREFMDGRRRVRVAVVGAGCSGKTVFLTSLANHLKHHDRWRFDLNGWESIRGEGGTEIERNDRMRDFDYDRMRGYFSRSPQEWPCRTETCSVLRLPLSLRKDGTTRRMLLEVLDLPGARVSDFPMIGRSFDEWSEWMDGAFSQSGDWSGYVESLKAAADGATALDAYRRFLAQEYGRLSPWLMPSIVKMDTDGTDRGSPTQEGFLRNIKDAPVGVDAESQFVPVPPRIAAALHEDGAWRERLAGFRRHYARYREMVVAPIADWLKDVDHVFYLVDVLSLMRRGPFAAEREANFGRALLGIFARMGGGDRFLQRMWDGISDFLTIRPKNICIVATKADEVARETDRESLVKVLRATFREQLDGLSRGETRTSVRAYAAVRTTEPFSGQGALRARLERCDPGTVDYRAPEIPDSWPWERWPDDWRQRVPAQQTFPLFDAAKGEAPPQFGLDVLARMMLSV